MYIVFSGNRTQSFYEIFKVDPNVIKLQNYYSGWKKRMSEAGVGFKTLTD